MDLTAPVKGGTALISLLFNYFTEVLGNPRYVPYDDSRHATAPTGWNSWLAFFDQSTEQDIVEAADWVAVNPKPGIGSSNGMRKSILEDPNGSRTISGPRD
jgi:hypothetical protein